jgi:hypothetical protein
MGNRESKDSAAHAARLAEEAEIKPAAVADDLKEEHDIDKGRATVQGGRWLEKNTPPHGISSQTHQSDVLDAAKASHQPAAQEKEALKEAARHQASGGRW